MKQISFIIALSCTVLLSSCRKDCTQATQCQLAPNVGPCNLAIPSYYYDKSQNKCLEFIWGGCLGERPFETKEACEQACDCKM